MNDEERFQLVLTELRQLLIELETAGLREHVVLIGGQVVALRSLADGGNGTIRISTNTGIVVDRGFSFEPDLLFDVDAASDHLESLTEILRRCGFGRTSRSHRWEKKTGTIPIELDLFVPPDTDAASLPTTMTEVPGGDVAIARAEFVTVPTEKGPLHIAIPDAVGFLRMKLDAKLRLRPKQTRDCFDIFAYVSLVGVDVVRKALDQSARDAAQIRSELLQLFGEVNSAGVRDVVASSTLEHDESELLARAVVERLRELF